MADPDLSAPRRESPATSGGAEQRVARPWSRRAWRFGGYLLAAYIVWCVVLFLMQDWMVFPRELAGQGGSTPPAGTVVMAERLDEGGQVVAWLIPAPGRTAERPGPLVFFFHGNAELIEGQDDIVRVYRRLGCSVLLPEYRGYGQSGGSPSESAIVFDAVRFLDRVVKAADVDSTRIVLHGRSLGGGVAAQVAARRPPAALILQSTFVSMIPFAHRYGVPGFLVKHTFRTDRVLAGLKAPLLVFHGTRDSIIPVGHGRKLKDLVPGSLYVEYDCDHNDFPGAAEGDYFRAIESFLRSAHVLGDVGEGGLEQPELTGGAPGK